MLWIMLAALVVYAIVGVFWGRLMHTLENPSATDTVGEAVLHGVFWPYSAFHDFRRRT